jgi:hypothetical protein
MAESAWFLLKTVSGGPTREIESAESNGKQLRDETTYTFDEWLQMVRG